MGGFGNKRRTPLYGGNGREAAVFLLCLVLAFSIWLIHNLSLNYSEIVVRPVDAVCNIEGYAEKSAAPALVTARCRTSGFTLIRFRGGADSAPATVRFDASDLHPRGDGLFFITSSELDKYSGDIFTEETAVSAYLTDTLVFKFTPEAGRKLPLRAVADISYRPQYDSPSGLRLSPDSVMAYGNPSVLEGLGSVSTSPVSYMGLSSSKHGEVRLQGISGVRLSEYSAEYHIDVVRFVQLSRECPVGVEGLPPGASVRIYPQYATVTYRCPFPIAGAGRGDVRVNVSYEDFASSLTGRCVPSVAGLPEGAFRVEVEPEVFTVVELK